ncbi:serine-rich protein [Neofusicoccum parvum]|nr:serine-rich protein [Neofusicoccum parvum]
MAKGLPSWARENWAPSPAPAEDDDADENADDSDNYSAGIEPHQPSTSHTNNQQRLSISEIPTTTDHSHGTQRRYQQGPLRMFGPTGPDSNETPRLHREQSSTFRCFRPSSWIVGGGSSSGASVQGNPDRPAADRQMWLFCLGFVVPFAWFLAAFLPVPPKRSQSFSTAGAAGTADESEKGREVSGYAGRHAATDDDDDDDDGPRVETGSGGVVDVEAQAHEASGAALAERERVRAVWWRTLNRRMSLLGVAVIIVVVVAVAVTLTAA